MKILCCGLGSIGQRHVRNLRALMGDAAEILAWRARGLPHVVTDDMRIEPGVRVEARYGIRTVASLSAGLGERPDVVLVSNPTRFHVETARSAVEAGCHVFVEKPLSDSLDGVDDLVAAVEGQQVVSAVGFQQRFHPAIERLRALVCRRAVGRIVSVHARMAEYLPDAHPYEDYRQTYPARTALGGGAINCYCHEFDYLHWIFGAPRQVRAAGGRLGSLDIDVEDTARVDLDVDVEGRLVPMTIELSFLDRPTEKRCVVVGEAGVIRVDLVAPCLTVTAADGAMVEHETFPGFTRNQTFLDEWSRFLSAIRGDGVPAVTIAEAAGSSLRVAMAAHRSLRTGEAVTLG